LFLQWPAILSTALKPVFASMVSTTLYNPQGNLFTGNNQGNYLKFLVFHSENPVVYRLFEKFALQLIDSGHDKLGAKMIIERIRWEMKTKSKDAAGDSAMVEKCIDASVQIACGNWPLKNGKSQRFVDPLCPGNSRN